jgi:hypothetical protein
MRTSIIAFYLIFISTVSWGGERYISIERLLYKGIEYDFLVRDSSTLFVLNQPYEYFQLDSSSINESLRQWSTSKNLTSDSGISLLIRPGISSYGSWDGLSTNPSVLADGYFKISDLIGVVKLNASKALLADKDFHGDKGEWVSAYIVDAYTLYSPNESLSLFSGRLSRNLGIPNEYGLLLSNNPYSYDHFGLSAHSKWLQYSWFTGRLNDMHGVDIQGITIPLGEKSLVQRYLAWQRLDLRFGNKLQIGIAEATIYGGPGQSFVAAYINPLNFYYLSQRNQHVQMNGSWQINAFYYFPRKIGLYLDFYIDDFIINNDQGVDDRSKHPDRLAFMTKAVIPDITRYLNLVSLRYVRVQNETYVSFRNYENWIFFNKSLGFPFRSFEGLRFEISYLENQLWSNTSSLEIWRHGHRNLFSTMIDDASISFPAPDVISGLDISSQISILKGQFDSDITLDYSYFGNNELGWEGDVRLLFTIGYNINFMLIQ